MKNNEPNIIDYTPLSTSKEEQIKKAKARKKERIRQAIENLASVGITEERMRIGKANGESAMTTIAKISEERAKTHPAPPYEPTLEDHDLNDIIDELFEKSDLLEEKNKEIKQLKNYIKELEDKLAVVKTELSKVKT